MKRYYSIILLVCGLLTTYQSIAQKHDYHFYQKRIYKESGMHVYYVDSISDIVFEPFVWDVGTVSRTPALSDKDGNFLCFSNNRNVYDSIGRVAINGDSIGVGWFQEYIIPMVPPEHKGLATGQNAAFIPITDSLFYYFHKSSEISTANPDFAIDLYEKDYRLNSYSDGLYLTKVRLNKDGRMYILPHEKKLVLIDDLLMYRQLAFVKKAKNDGWWIIVPRIETGEAYLLSLDLEGNIDNRGTSFLSENNARLLATSTLIFNPIGDKLARLLYRTPSDLKQIVEIWDFDRCTGQIGERIYYDSIDIAPNPYGGGELEFSENGRFLYIALSEYILQMDMDNITLPADTIAVWDGYEYYGLAVLLGELIRLPNGKILVGSVVSTPFLHYIHNPNEKGSDCNFEQRALMMPKDPLNDPFYIDFEGFPTFPPYRMPPLAINCEDGVDEKSKDNNNIKIYPNPAHDNLHIHIEGEAGIEVISLYNISGEKVYHEVISGSFFIIDVRGINSGIYIVSVLTTDDEIINSKVIIN